MTVAVAKACSKCGLDKPLEAFSKNRTKKDGLQTWCKECFSKRHEQNRHVALAQMRRWKAAQRGESWDGEADYEALLERQNGVCAICGCKPDHERNNGRGVLAVDHDHDTLQVRGLLCGRCNMGIGLMDDNIDFLAASMAYLLTVSG